ncbi:MAG: hypothetical protein GEV08_22060 [Acidimicrobiia bacterium]|nr:hypothetical protein [Acidimicrobiia bacterium]
MARTGASLAELLRHAELELDEERRAALLPALEQVEAAIAAVRAVDVGELPPATAFDARWE